VGSKSFSSRRDALALVENFQSIFSENAEAVHLAPSSFTDLQTSDEVVTAETLNFATQADDNEEPYHRKENPSEQRARFKAELFDSAEKQTADAEESSGILSISQNMPRWMSAFNAVSAAQIAQLARSGTPKVVRYTDSSGTSGKVSCKPSATDVMCDVELAAKRALSAVLFTIWHTVIIDREGRHLENFARQHQRVYWNIAKRCGTAYDASMLWPVRSYYDLSTAKAQARRHASIRRMYEEEEKRKANTGRRLHRKAA
jgi:hypothetical protein